MKKLPTKARQTCLDYIECGIQVVAYRKNYSTKNQKDKTTQENSRKFFLQENVIAFVDELHAEQRAKLNVTVESISRELDQARDLAKEGKHASSMVAAILGKAKVHGLLRDDKTINFKRIDDMNEAELLEALGGEPDEQELRTAIGGEKVGEA